MKENMPFTGSVDLKAMLAELWGTTLLVLFGAGTAIVHGYTEVLIVAFSFGAVYLALSFALMHHSGAHLNPAITFSLLLGTKISFFQALCNWFAQFAGAILGALILWGIHPCSQDLTFNLGSNVITDSFSESYTFLGEFLGTTLICFVYWETVVSPFSYKNRLNSCVAMGFSYFLCHLILIRIDGAGLNPARSLGTAVVAKSRYCGNFKTGAIEDLWIMIIAPAVGSVLAAALQFVFGPFLYQDRLARNSAPDTTEESASPEGL